MVKNDRKEGEEQSTKAELYHEREAEPIGLRPETRRSAAEYSNYRTETDKRNRNLSER